MDDVFLLQLDKRTAATIMGALDPPHQVTLVQDLADLEARLRNGRPQACILDVFAPPRAHPLNPIRGLRLRHPAVALVVASDFGGREMDLYRLGRLDVDGVIRMETGPSSRDISSVVDEAVAASLGKLVVLRAGDDLSPLVKTALRWSIEHAETRPLVSELAEGLAPSHGALVREMKALRLSSPRSLLLWGRLIRASHLLERPFETVESVAFQLGYSTGGALGKALKRHLGCSPSELLKRGGLSWTLEVFLRKGLLTRA